MIKSSTRILRPGRFVWTFDKYCIGQVIDLQNRQCTVRFFISINESVDHVYDTANLQVAYLHPQTRAYVCGEDRNWTVGRVVDGFLEGDEVSYTIQFPNRIHRRIPEEDLRIRCLLPIEDPTAVLAAGGIETQFLHDKRRAVLECLTETRASSYGLAGLLSASVELFPHQVEVVRRVLSDPIQRYLLADEVGLGKTIESCTIIRQAILDNPEERVVILAPASLTGQWIKELTRRFFIQAPQSRLLVIPFEQLHRLEPSQVDTLVIDEAHNLIPTEPIGDPIYAAIESLALNAHRLLLISATPVLGHERTLLALMHLLDPQTYRLDEERTFIQKVEHRQEFGRLLLALNPNQRPAFLLRTLELIRKMALADAIMSQYIASIELGIKTQQEDIIYKNIRVLQHYISDTYRLHQRLVRTRRRDLPEDVLAPRTSILAKLEEDDDERTPLVIDAIEQWRQRSLEALETKLDNEYDEFESRMAIRYSRLYEALGTSVEACAEELSEQLDLIKAGHELSFQNDENALALALDKTEEETFENRSGLAMRVIQNALHALVLKTKHPRLVVFGTSSDFVLAVAGRLEGDRQIDVFQVVESSNEEKVVEAVEGFLTASGPAVLVCDRRGEEGLNLQFAHGIVHLDLPLSPARIEQRIGRLDRFGRERNPIREIYQWVITPYFDDYHPWQAWFELLRDGFKVFDESISEVQFLLDDLQSTVRLALYHRGAIGLQELTSKIVDAMAQERQRLDEQYALDRRTTGPGDPDDAFRAIEQIDTTQHFKPFDEWVTKVLRFGRQPLDDIHNTFRLHWNQRTLLPKEPWQELIGETQLAQPMTYDRIHATYSEGIRLVRPGFELVDSITKLLLWDDRGTAFATWRSDPQWTGEGRGIWMGFRLTYVLEANVELAKDTLVHWADSTVVRSLRRRMDALLPPWTITLDVDIEMNPVTDPLLKEILSRPYSTREDELGRRDFNLGNRRNALYELIGFDELAGACKLAKDISERLLLNSPQFHEWADTSTRQAIRTLTIDRERLAQRKDAIFRETKKSDPSLEQDIRVNEAIAYAIASPSIRLDAVGLFVVSNTKPQMVEPVENEEDM